MRIAILVGLLYVAFAINHEYMDSMLNSSRDIWLINIAFFLAFITDLVELYKKIVK